MNASGSYWYKVDAVTEKMKDDIRIFEFGISLK